MSLVRVQGVGKSYRKYTSEWHRVGRWLGLPARVQEEQWVLRHISFTLESGQAVGIVGENGAGKSTLLKLLTGTVKPSEGFIEVNGRISAILELGMGFDQELTARQNVVHSAGLMGFSHAQIEAVMPEVEEFAEIGAYFDAPMRTYSSGMQMRVAFSVATAYRPEILIVDEALSVGDTYFQHKCFNRIREFQKQGTTLLIVSHDRSAIQSLCDRALLLEGGLLIREGAPEEIMDYYNAILADKQKASITEEVLPNGRVQILSGTGEARVFDIGLYNSEGKRVEVVDVGEEVSLRVRVEAYQDLPRLVFGYGIRDRMGQILYGTNTHLKKQALENVRAGELFEFEVNFAVNLGCGSYAIQTALVSNDTHLEKNYEWRDVAMLFNVVNIQKEYFDGCLWMDPSFTIGKI